MSTPFSINFHTSYAPERVTLFPPGDGFCGSLNWGDLHILASAKVPYTKLERIAEIINVLSIADAEAQLLAEGYRE